MESGSQRKYYRNISSKFMKVALCVIARLENKYIREYIEYYRDLGFDKIFIYDNNRPDEEKIVDEVKDFVDDGFVDVIDWKHFCPNDQRTSYQDCWDKHHNEYDWIAFFDADEYLTLNYASNIKDFLNNKIYDGYYIVTVGAEDYDDNDIIINDSKTRLDKYTRRGKKQVDNWVKSIIRCEGNIVDFLYNGYYTFHVPKIEHQELICDVDGHFYNMIQEKSFIPGLLYSGGWKNAFLKHIPTGCIDDFAKYKNVRKHIHWHDFIGIQYFRDRNEMNQEKEDYITKNKIK